MKQFFRFREGLLPKRKDGGVTPTMPLDSDSWWRRMWMEYKWAIILMIALVILLSNIFSYGQELKKGDHVPDLSFSPISNYKQGAARLSDFKGQVVILDFWATWCAPCVMMIPKMDSLQKEFAGKVQFIGVAYQSEFQVRSFFQKLEAQRGRRYDLPEVCADTGLSKLFKPGSFPHYVWIGADGTMAAVTEFQDVTRENIRKLLDGGTVATTVKPVVDLAYDYHQPMLINGNGGDGSNLLYHSFLTGYTPGLHPGMAIVIDSISGKKITCKNNCIHWLYELAYSDSGRSFNRQNTRYLVRDTSLITNRKAAGQAYLDWLAQGNGYCYELQVPPSLASSALQMMRQDLDRYFTQYSASVVGEQRQCLVLSRTKDSPLLQTGKDTSLVRIDRFGWKVVNCPLGLLCDRLNFFQTFPLQVVDETGLSAPVDLEIPIRSVTSKGRPDIEVLNKELAPYGLQLSQQERRREILIIKDRQPLTKSK